MAEEEAEGLEEPKKTSKIKNLLWYLTLIIGLVLVIFYWGLFIDLNKLLFGLERWVPKIAVVLLTIFIVNLFIKLSLPVLRRAYLSRGGTLTDWKVASSVYVYLAWALTALVILTGLLGSLASLGLSIGIIGAGLAFALQQPILSFSGWFLIMLKRPFNIGDRIILPKEGLKGDVEDITMFFFVLKEITEEESQTGKSVAVPNSTIFQGPIINYHCDTPHIWVSIPVEHRRPCPGASGNVPLGASGWATASMPVNSMPSKWAAKATR